MSRGATTTRATPPGVALDQVEAYRAALAAIELQRWTDASERLLELARRAPDVTRYRALLAYVRGQMAAASGDHRRADEEWRRALTLEPRLPEAQRAREARARRSSWLTRLFRPS